VARPVWLLTDAGMDDHAAAGHPERPDRREAAAVGVRDAAGDALAEPSVQPITDAEARLVHDAAYLELLTAGAAQGGGWLDGDTYLGPGSVEVARLAAGATVQAARAVAAGEAAIAFAAVRPPGHHARSDRASGFCLLNNVALAVACLRHDGSAQRIAIVDWDVHHGDGTQEIFDADADLLYTSTHQFPFYPGTGSAAESGRGAASGTKLNRPLLAGDGDEAFTAAWVDELIPAVEAFAPDAILVSAGYDAHAADPLAELTVTEAGFEVVATALGGAARRLGLAGVALTLEGGYDLDALRRSAAASVHGLLEGGGWR
jgi:acetoin utilization deacetylase AcuC-like enzyme